MTNRARAAADIIASLPDTIVDGDKLREVVADHHIDMSEELMEALGALLPDPPTMEGVEWDDAEHYLAEATTPGGLVVVMVSIDDDAEVIWCADPDTELHAGGWHPKALTPTGRKYRLEPEDDTPASSIEDKPASEPASRREELTWKLQALLPDPEPASPRPDGCCGACPETVGGGVDCTCADNPRCPNRQPRPEDVPVDEPWQLECDGETAIGFRNDPDDKIPWIVVHRNMPIFDYLYDTDVTLIARLVPETTEQDEESEGFDPAYTYRDKDGDEWEYIDGGWFTGDTHAKRVAKREYRVGRASLPAEFGPYTRIEDTK